MPVSTLQMLQYSPADGTWDLIPGFEGELSVQYWENIFPPEAVCWWAVGWRADQIVYYAWEATNACSGEVMMPGVVGELPGPPGTQGPPGPVGPEGPPGPALKFVGSWVNTIQYQPGDVVTYDAGNGVQTWVCNTQNFDSPPSVTNINWALLPSTAGAQGPQGPPGNTGPAGAQGPAGPASTVPGPQGPPGQGVPTGGATATVLTKNSPANYDTSFQPLPVPPPGIPSGGIAAQSLVKNTGTNYDATFQFQGLPVFATAAARDSQWTSPPNGAMCVTLDTGTRWQYFSALSLWYKPNTVLSQVDITSAFNGITTGPPVQIAITGTILIPANRRVIVTAKVFCEFLENGGQLFVTVDGAYLPDNQLAIEWQTDPLYMQGDCSFVLAGGGHVFALQAQAVANTMNVRGDIHPCWMQVRDWGSA